MEKNLSADDFTMVIMDPATCHRCFFWTDPIKCSENPLVHELWEKFKPGGKNYGCWIWNEKSKFENGTMPMANWKLIRERQMKLF